MPCGHTKTSLFYVSISNYTDAGEVLSELARVIEKPLMPYALFLLLVTFTREEFVVFIYEDEKFLSSSSESGRISSLILLRHVP